MTAESGHESPWHGDGSCHAQGDLMTTEGGLNHPDRVMIIALDRVI
jgi:hypothetical protein